YEHEGRRANIHLGPSRVARRRSNSSTSISPRAILSSRIRRGPPIWRVNLPTAHTPNAMRAPITSRLGNHIHQLISNIDPMSEPITMQSLLQLACLHHVVPPSLCMGSALHLRWLSRRSIRSLSRS